MAGEYVIILSEKLQRIYVQFHPVVDKQKQVKINLPFKKIQVEILPKF